MHRRYLRACVTAAAALLATAGTGAGWAGAPPAGTASASAGTASAGAFPDLPTTVEPAPGLPGYNVYRPTDLGATGERLPVVTWGNGGCFRHDATWAPLLERWAAAGYVVVSITTAPGGFPWEQHTAQHQAAAIDWAEQQDATPGSPYAGHLDLDRVVASGNSCGGVTALGLASTDPRVASVFVLSGSSSFPGAPPGDAEEVIDAITAPIGYAVGGPEDISRAAAQQDLGFAEHVPAYLAARARGDHLAVSTDPAVLAEVAEIGLHWMAFTLDRSPEARAALEADPCASCAPGLWVPDARNFDLLGDDGEPCAG